MPKFWNETEAYVRNVGFDMKVAYEGSGRQEYVGYARPGAATSTASWQIFKLAYDGSGRMTTRRYADGTDDFTKIWDNYTTYTYLGI